VARTVKTRPYDSSRRHADAAARRRRVLDASRARFLADGYAATTVAAVAEAAGVSPETIYKSFGGKTGLVRALRDDALRGAGPEPAETRSDRLRAEADPRIVVRGWARLATEVAPRVVPILLLVRDAGASDSAMKRLYEQMDADRLRRMSDNAGYLYDGGHLRPGITHEHAADLLFAVSSPEMYELLVLRRGWDLERFADFTYDTITSGLLRPQFEG
jgi:AcrR family transcriptional regulator